MTLVDSVRRRGGSVRYVWDRGEGVVMERKGMRSFYPTTSQILGLPGFWLQLQHIRM